MKQFLSFCQWFGVLSPFPALEATLSRFVAFLFQEKLSGATVKDYLVAVHYTQIALELGDPVKGLKRSSTGPKRTRLPITTEILHVRRIKDIWLTWSNRRDAFMLWAAVTMCSCGFLHSGEVVVSSQTGYDPASHLSFGDVLMDSTVNPQCIEIRIKASKMELFQMGVSMYLGRTDNDLCPVAA